MLEEEATRSSIRKRSADVIMNEEAKKASFKKRQLTVNKKAYELSTLCGIDVCIICYASDGELHTWPEDKNKVREIALKYSRLGVKEKSKKRLDLEGFLRKMRLEEEKKNFDVETKFPAWDETLDGYSEERLKELNCFLESNLERLCRRAQLLDDKKKEKEKKIGTVGSNRKNDSDSFSAQELCQTSLPFVGYEPDCSNNALSTLVDSQAVPSFTNLMEPTTNFAAWPYNYYSPGSSRGSNGNLISPENMEFNNGYQFLSLMTANSIGSINSLVPMEKNMEDNSGFLLPSDCGALDLYQPSTPLTGYQNLLAHGIDGVWPQNHYHPVMDMASQSSRNNSLASLENYTRFLMAQSCDNNDHLLPLVNTNFPQGFAQMTNPPALPQMMTAGPLNQMPIPAWTRYQPPFQHLPFQG